MTTERLKAIERQVNTLSAEAFGQPEALREFVGEAMPELMQEVYRLRCALWAISNKTMDWEREKASNVVHEVGEIARVTLGVE